MYLVPTVVSDIVRSEAQKSTGRRPLIASPRPLSPKGERTDWSPDAEREIADACPTPSAISTASFDDSIHLLTRDHPELWLLDTALHFLVEQDPEKSLQKSIQFNLPKIIDQFTKRRRKSR